MCMLSLPCLYFFLIIGFMKKSHWFLTQISSLSGSGHSVVTLIRSSLPFISSTETEPEFSLIQVCFWGQEYFIRGIMYFLQGAQKVWMGLLFLCKPLVMATDDHYLCLFFHWWLIVSSFGTFSYEGNTGLELPMDIL